MAGAGAGAGPKLNQFFANGHGEQCLPETGVDEYQSLSVGYTLPPGVHFITIQEAGRPALLVSVDALRSLFERGVSVTRIPPKPTFDKKDDPDGWCSSEFMRFKHDIAKAFGVLTAMATEDEERYGPLLDFAGRGGPSWLTFDELLLKRNEDASTFQQLCDLYDARIHIRYPGQTISDNLFFPISYILDDSGNFSEMDGGSGVIGLDTFSALPREDKSALTQRYRLRDLTKDRLIQLFRSSVYPTEKEVSEYLNKSTTQTLIRQQTQESTQIGKMLAVLQTRFKVSLSRLFTFMIEKYAITAENPMVLYYPLCRVLSKEPTTEEGRRAVETELQIQRSRSLLSEESGAQSRGRPLTRSAVPASRSRSRGPKGGRRRTYRKKKLRTQTRKRRQ